MSQTEVDRIIEEQDRQLEVLSNDLIPRLRDQGLAIHDQLTEHNEMLDDAINKIEATESRLGRARRQLRDVRNKAKDKGLIATIGGLVTVLVTLVSWKS
jgi:syntaxin 8